MNALKPKRRPERNALRVVKGGYAPADATTATRLRQRGHRVGDLVFAEFKKPRNPGFHRLAHVFGQLVADNIDDFTGMDSHEVLKRIQVESGFGCDELRVDIGAVWPVVVDWVRVNLGAPFATVLSSSLEALGAGTAKVPVRLPRSLSFESMDDGEFRTVFRGFAEYIARRYWPSMTPDQIEQLALAAPGEA
jgi:hypothetical protein